MARIRSIHPGFFTDEDLVSVGMAARLLFLGLGVEADDKGIFEWKPLTIKMRVFPADNVDVTALLDELESAGAICRYELSGKSYGAIRNFRKFQKPKTPNDIYPTTTEIRAFVGLSSETDGDNDQSFPQNGETFPQKGEKLRQMEDGGGKSNSVSNETGARPNSDREFWANAKSYIGGKNPGGIIGKWCKEHPRPEVAKAITAAQVERVVDPVSYVTATLKRRRADVSAMPLA